MTKRAKKSKIPIYRLENSIEDWSRISEIFFNRLFWPYKTVTLLYFPTMRAMNRQDENVGLYTHTNKDLHFSGSEIYEWRYTYVLKTTLLPPSARQKSSWEKKMKKKSIFFSTILIRLEGNTCTTLFSLLLLMILKIYKIIFIKTKNYFFLLLIILLFKYICIIITRQQQ